MRVLILNGAAESGKGTVSMYIKELLNLRVKRYSSIDYIKNIAKEKFGWDEIKDVKGRNLLSALKQCGIAYNDLPTKKVITEIEKYTLLGNTDLVIVDVREPDEIEKIINYCKEENITWYTCRIHNAKAERNAEINDLSLTGDRLYGKYDYDIDLYNNGTLEELKKEVRNCFHGVQKGKEKC